MKKFMFIALIISDFCNGVNVNSFTTARVKIKKDSRAWIKYREGRGEHDCSINESHNWLGSQEC